MPSREQPLPRRETPPDAVVRPDSRPAWGPREAALRLLSRQKWDEAARESALRPLDERDRALAAGIAAGTLRMRGAIDFYLGHFLHQDLSVLPTGVLNLLRTAVFQLRWLDRVPDWAVVSESVELAKRIEGGRHHKLVNAVLRRFIREADSVPLPSLESEPVRALSVRHSFPEWLVGRWLDRYGPDETVRLLEALNRPAPLTLRAHATAEGAGRQSALEDLLRGEGIQFSPGAYAPEALSLESGANPVRLPGYAEGLFYVQDEAAMLVSRLAAPAAGATVLDLCAAPGGKSTHLAELAGPGATIAAAEPAPVRLGVLRRNIERLKAGNVFAVEAEALHPPFRPADTVLCDVPCSGTGVIRRKPDLRWRLAPDDLVSLPALQGAILAAAAEVVRPGGVLLYATCSLEPEENRAVVNAFLRARGDFSLQDAHGFLPAAVVSAEGFLETRPQSHGIDGVFGARLLRQQ
ncbi:16S rRNA (cytosine(967)-C(5))-methyltransferase RsmB [bacterium]|nr:16S rRNA (cytosine(967)-C(5))-methyltransferase RsmB [bacterium]